MKAIYWFQNDFRLEDQAGLHWLSEQRIPFVGVAFEPPKASSFRKTFFWQTALEFQKNLQSLGLDLFLFSSLPEETILAFAKCNQATLLLKSECFSGMDSKLEESFKNAGIEIQTFHTQTLLSLDALPFLIKDLPLVFTDFRKAVEKNFSIAPCLLPPKTLQGFTASLPHNLSQATAPRFVELPFGFRGGEEAGRARLQEYFFETRSLSNYKNTRNGLIEKNDSSKFSPWLSLGAISARWIYWKCKEYEDRFGANDSTYWLVFELLWRDYFKFLAKRFGLKIFSRQGLRKSDRSWSTDATLFQQWKEGNTESSFINANMKELLQTGWMSNRGRQNAASYLAKTLGIDWTWGAQWFEEQLLDFDRESNWGNWLYQSGMGTDPRDRIFDPHRQASMYDPEGKYQSLWGTKK